MLDQGEAGWLMLLYWVVSNGKLARNCVRLERFIDPISLQNWFLHESSISVLSTQSMYTQSIIESGNFDKHRLFSAVILRWLQGMSTPYCDYCVSVVTGVWRVSGILFFKICNNDPFLLRIYLSVNSDSYECDCTEVCTVFPWLQTQFYQLLIMELHQLEIMHRNVQSQLYNRDVHCYSLSSGDSLFNFVAAAFMEGSSTTMNKHIL